MDDRHYREELAALRSLAREFGTAHPDCAALLAAEATDPDVERLLEGTAFLCARMRQRLDDEFPALAHDLLDLLWQRHLLPHPSCTLLRFTPLPHAREAVTVPEGAVVESDPIDGTRCRFVTSAATRTVPLTGGSCAWHPDGIRAAFTVPEGADMPSLLGAPLRLHLLGDPAAARWMRWRLATGLRGVTVRRDGHCAMLPASALRLAGTDELESLLPGEPGPRRLRLISELVAFPAKFLAIDLVGLDRLDLLAGAVSFELVLELAPCTEAPPPGLVELAAGCVPAVNVFAAESEPIMVDSAIDRIPLRAHGDPRHLEVFDVQAVEASLRDGREPRRFVPAHRRLAGEQAPGWRVRREPRCDGDGGDAWLLLDGIDAIDDASPIVISSMLRCTNRSLPTRVAAADIRHLGSGCPAGVRVTCVVGPTRPQAAPASSAWHGLATEHLALHAGPVADAGALRRMLALAGRGDPSAAARWIAAIDGLRVKDTMRWLDGLPVRGAETTLTFADAPGIATADLHLLASVLDVALADASGLNRFHRLRIELANGGGWRHGDRLGAVGLA